MPDHIRQILRSAREARVFSAAAWSVGDESGPRERGTLGTLSWGGEELREGDYWDLASVSKSIVAIAVMSLVETGQLSLEDTVGALLPDYPEGKAGLTVAQLLTHTTGLPGQIPLFRWNPTAETLLAAVRDLPALLPPGTDVIYSSQGYIILGLLAEAACGQSLDALVRERVLLPAGMAHTSFGLDASLHSRAVATEDDPWRGRILQGEVHDENAAVIGRPAGHAGLFSTLGDMELLGAALAAEGRGARGRILSSSTYRVMIEPRTDHLSLRKTFGWMNVDRVASSGGDLIGARGYGHTGFTGTSLWIDPDARRYAVLLTNRVHPTRDNPAIGRVRRLVHNVAFGTDFPTSAR